MMADLHSHYPMHLLEEWASGRDIGPVSSVERMRRLRRPNKFRALLLNLLSRRINRRTPTSPPRVTVDGMVKGEARLVFSVLYSPFAEIDLDRPFQADPVDGYFAHLENQIRLVDQDLALAANAQRARVATTGDDLDRARTDGAVGIVHCVEGAFHLGATPASIEANVATPAWPTSPSPISSTAVSRPTSTRSRSSGTGSTSSSSRSRGARG